MCIKSILKHPYESDRRVYTQVFMVGGFIYEVDSVIFHTSFIFQPLVVTFVTMRLYRMPKTNRYAQNDKLCKLHIGVIKGFIQYVLCSGGFSVKFIKSYFKPFFTIQAPVLSSFPSDYTYSTCVRKPTNKHKILTEAHI